MALGRFTKIFIGMTALCAAAPVAAEESLLSSLVAPSAERNHWFGDISASVRVQEIPEIGLFNIEGTSAPATTLNPSIVMGGGSLTLGHVFGKQLDPQLWGGRAHMAVAMHYFVGSDDEDISIFDPPASINFIDLSGDDIGMYDPIVGSARTRLQDWGAELRGGLDFDQGNGWMLTPSIAFFGAHSELSQTIGFFEDEDVYYDKLDNDVRNTRLGTAFGLGATRDLGGFLLLIGAEFGVDYNMTKADVFNCLGYLSEPICDGDNLYEEGSLDERKFGFFANMALGVAFNIGFARVAIEGQGGYDSYIPTIDYGNAPGQVTEIGEEGDFNYGGGITVTIPLN